ncbi:MAG: alpha-ketoacid dehydrogenase subunit beta [Candidatus Abyssobacteria bacterium SURF_17]|uniref:Alpha-ketoacid dehydrogenase subunit beta n=1 Tax=Candidatus Abyssobacteria bacterium SURF_17 TaxID=2093361 RepID=A0A419ETP0_9BACT|nr:MAG: alpha-ketoacid dehydrogenase subunit beta [Candidatus Abyssubacteria bacterium SURF_17]
MPEITMVEAIRLAMKEEMERDESVMVIGEDVGMYGGAFRATEGLYQQFGPNRVVDTPISESAIVGVALGLAIMGFRPVAEIQFADFISCGFDQIVNQTATLRYRTAGDMFAPMVIRAPSAAGVHGGLYHSQSPEGWFAHTPGVKVIVPSSAYDAKGLLKAAIRDDDPVIFFEPKYLYRRAKDDVPEDDYVIPIGKANVLQEGDDVSLITYGSMVHHCRSALEKLEAEDLSIELIDLRSIMPLDKETIYASVKKTNRVVLAYEDHKTLGIGAEIAALLSEELFEYLDTPIVRVAAPDTPVPYSPPLEEFYLPKEEDIVKAVHKVIEY